MNNKVKLLEMFSKFIYKSKTNRIQKEQKGIKYYIKLFVIKILNKLPNSYVIEKNKKYLEKSKK